MSSVNAVKTKMMHKDIIKICSLQKGEVWAPGARQSQNDVTETSNFILIPLAMVPLSQHKHQHYPRVKCMCPFYCYKFS